MSLRLEQSAALTGTHCWAERRLFEILGTWSAEAVAPAVVLCLDRHSQHAAWRGDEWWNRLPVLAALDRASLVVPGTVWSSWADPVAVAGDVARLAWVYRMALPRLAVAYARHEAATAPAADGAVRRTLGHVRPDVAADWAEGEALLQDLLVDGAGVDEAAGVVGSAERRFVT